MTTENLPRPAALQLRDLIFGYRITQAIYVAAKLDLARHLADGPMPVAALARACGVPESSLLRLLRLLVHARVLESTPQNAARDDGGTEMFSLTEIGALLDERAPGAQRGVAMLHGESFHWRAWGNLIHSIRTEQAAFDDVFGCGRFEYFGRDPEAAMVFSQGQGSLTQQEADAIVATYDFSRVEKVVDVGGGYGALIIAILRANPHLSGVVYDLPYVAEGAREAVAKAGLASRCSVVGGSFFDEVPSGGDLYIIKRTIHNWTDEKAAVILKNCRRAMKPNGGRLVVAERLVADFRDPHTVMSDLQMLVMDGSGERSEEQFRALFASAGFELARTLTARCAFPLSLLEGTPTSTAR